MDGLCFLTPSLARRGSSLGKVIHLHPQAKAKGLSMLQTPLCRASSLPQGQASPFHKRSSSSETCRQLGGDPRAGLKAICWKASYLHTFHAINNAVSGKWMKKTSDVLGLATGGDDLFPTRSVGISLAHLPWAKLTRAVPPLHTPPPPSPISLLLVYCTLTHPSCRRLGASPHRSPAPCWARPRSQGTCPPRAAPLETPFLQPSFCWPAFSHSLPSTALLPAINIYRI